MSEESSSSTPTATKKIKLQKNLGLFNGVTIIVGCIIGSGIFVSPKGVLMYSGSVGGCLLVWVLCGIISLVGALCYGELGTMILKSGSDYAYINEAYGPLPAFLFMWTLLIVAVPATSAIAGLSFAYYILQPIFPTCDPPQLVVRLLAAFAIGLLTFVNCARVQWAAKLQNVFTVAKVLALMLVIVIGIVQIAKGRTENFQNAFQGTSTNVGQFALAFYSGLYSYAGWNYLNFVTEELTNPYRDLPRSIWISLPLITVIYVFANVAYFTVLSPQELLASNAVAVTFADKTMGVMAWSMPLFVAASTFGGLNGNIFSCARLFFVAARNGHLPCGLAMINITRYTPIPVLIFLCVISLLMLLSVDVYTLINYTAFVEASFVGISVSGLLYLRYKEPNRKRPIKVHLAFPIIFTLVTIFLIALPLINNPFECLVGVIVAFSGIPVYLLGVVWTKKPKSFTQFVSKVTLFSQKLLLTVAEEKEDEEVTSDNLTIEKIID